MAINGVNILVAFLAGIVSCASPCVLPLAPVYVGSLVSESATVGVDDRRAPLLHALAFLTGFLLLFLALGLSIGLVGYTLRDQQPLLAKLGGVVLIVMGLHMSRIVEIPALYRGIGLDWSRHAPIGYTRSFLAGSSISVGWLPCIGPTLGAILSLAMATQTVAQSSVLLLVYGLGLAVPFLLVGIFLARTPAVLRWLQRHEGVIGLVAGLVMIGMGVVLFTGLMARLNGYFRFANVGPGSRI